MRALITIIISLFTTASCLSQHIEPVKGDNVIYIHTDSGASYNYNAFGKHLATNGYIIESSNREFLSLSTANKTSKGAYEHQLIVSFIDSTIIIRARGNFLLLGSTIYHPNFSTVDWEYYPSRSHIMNTHYQAFIPVLRSFSENLLFNNI